MDTYFASAVRSDDALLREEIKIISESPLVDMLMTTIGGLFAVLDENRQIVALNQAMMNMLGITNVEEILGARPGEAINCVHAAEMAGGCGTTRYCRTCGAVIAIISSLELKKPVQKTCVAEVTQDGKRSSMYLGVQASPMMLGDYQFVLLFLQDLSAQQKLAVLEKTFFHDTGNTLTALMGFVDLLAPLCEGKARNYAQKVSESAEILCKDVFFQKVLSYGNVDDAPVQNREMSVNGVVSEVSQLAERHRSAKGKRIIQYLLDEDITIVSDRYLIIKILLNMLLNALEASQKQDVVTIRVEKEPESERMIFSVWNPAAIDDALQMRIFQQNFTSKEGFGRGLGTYSMKMFGEEILKGEVYFHSNVEGTTFYFAL